MRPAVRALVAFFEGLCPEAVARFPEYYASDAYFKDPFNEVRGPGADPAHFRAHVQSAC
jgi:steroid delta-isomerase